MITINLSLYFIICIFLLIIGLILNIVSLIKFIKYYKKSNYLIKSFITLLVSDIICIMNFVSRDIYNIYLGKLDNSLWCKISAILAIGHFWVLFSGMFLIGLCTYKMIKKEKISFKFIIFWNIIHWIIGLSYGFFLYKLNIVGDYKNLYCCIKESNINHISVNIVTYITIFNIFVTLLFYILSYLKIKKDKSLYTIRNKLKRIILYRGFYFLFSFLWCWSLMIYKLLNNPFNNNNNISIFLEMCSSWLAKCMPIINSLILLNLYKKLEKREKFNNINRNIFFINF